MEIIISAHTREKAAERGATPSEIEDVVLNGAPILAKLGRQAKYKVFPFRNDWRGRYFEQKRVEVVYVAEQGVIITVTIYVFFGTWGGGK